MFWLVRMVRITVWIEVQCTHRKSQEITLILILDKCDSVIIIRQDTSKNDRPLIQNENSALLLLSLALVYMLAEELPLQKREH